MSLVLARIDDRLVHGQVIVGWGCHLNPDRIILCSDAIAVSDWEKDIYIGAGATAPFSLTISVLTIDETLENLNNAKVENEKIVLLVESPQEMLELARKGLKIKKVNVGGMHYKQGKTRLAPYIFVDDDDISTFEEMHQMEIEIEGKDVPSGKKIDIIESIESLKR